MTDEPRFPYRFYRTHTLAQLRAEYDSRLVAGDTTDDIVRVAGRAMTVRTQGKLIFVTLRDGTGEGQLFVSEGDIGSDEFGRFRDDVSRGDWIGAEGAAMKTKRSELSVLPVA